MGKIFLWERIFLGGEYSRGYVTLGDLTELLYEILINYLIFSLPNFLCGVVPAELSRGFFPRVLNSGK